ncbi:hypothetical protein ACLB2K_051260 [Fragaria x ananassa]
MAVPPNHPFKKLLIVGDKGVGMTSLLLRFSDIPIAGIELGVKTIELGNELPELATVDGILLMYDVTNELSFEHILKDMHNFPKNVKKILVGNKADVDDESKRAVRRRRGETLADIYDIMFLETSAKNNKNVEDVFFALASSTT